MEENQQLEISYDEKLDTRIILNGYGEYLTEYKQSEKEENTLNKMKGWEIYKRKEETKSEVKKLFGNYFHYVYDRVPKDTSSLSLVYMLFLATTLNYNDEYIRIGEKHDPSRSKTKKLKDIQEKLGISKRQHFNEIRDNLIDCGALKRDDDGYYYLNKKFVINGNIRKKGGYIRVFDVGFEEAYKNAKGKDKVLIGHALKLLPYCNLRYNVLCKDKEETKYNCIIPLSTNDIAEILDISNKNVSRLDNSLLKIKINGDFLFEIRNQGGIKRYFVNPNVFYGGDADPEAVKLMQEQFKIGIKEGNNNE